MDPVELLGLSTRPPIIAPLGPRTDPVIPVTSNPPAASSDWLVISWPVTVKWPSNDVKLKLYSCALLVKSLSVGTPEMIPVWALMLRPAGNDAVKVRVSPAAGATKWLETLSEKAWPSEVVWFAIAVAVGPLSPTCSWKLSLIALPWASVAVTLIEWLPKSPSVGTPELMPVWASMLRPVGNDPEKVRASPAAGATKWLEISSEKAWPSEALWLAIAVAVGPLSLT